jgi:putative membrane protein
MSFEFPEDRRDVSPEAWREWILFHNRERTQLSNERTFLAWVRTSLALITLGFLVQRFELFLARVSAATTSRSLPALVTWVPMLFFLLGGIIIALGTWEFFRVRNEIGRGGHPRRTGLRDALVVTTLVFLLVVSILFAISKP